MILHYFDFWVTGINYVYLRHVQFFDFVNFGNVLEVFIMRLNLWVYLFVFAFVSCLFILWYFVVNVICNHIILFGRFQCFHVSVIF